MVTVLITFKLNCSSANHFITSLSFVCETLWHYRSSRLYIFSIKMNPNGLQRFGSPSNTLKLTTGSKPQTVPQHALKIHPSSHWVTSCSLDFIWPVEIARWACPSALFWADAVAVPVKRNGYWRMRTQSAIHQCQLKHAFSLIACLEICELLEGSRNITVRLQQKSKAVCREADTLSFMWREEIRVGEKRGYVVQQLLFLSPDANCSLAVPPLKGNESPS